MHTPSRYSGDLSSRLDRVDWDFAGEYSACEFGPIHWLPGRLPAQVSASLIGLLTSEFDTVLDPFAGSGGVLLAAQRLNRRSIGVELSPVAARVARLATWSGRAEEWSAAVESAQRLPEKQVVAWSVPNTVQEKWYTPRTRERLAKLNAAITNTDGLTQAVARFAFSAILLDVCNETRHWGYVCDNTTPKSTRSVDPYGAFVAKLQRVNAAMEWKFREVQRRWNTRPPDATVVTGDARAALGRVEWNQLDAIITSPPYFGVVDYTKSQRLAYEWEGLDIERIRLLEVGARSKRRRTNARAQYLEEVLSVLRLSSQRLRSGGKLALVIGESASRAPVLDELTDRLPELGLESIYSGVRNVSPRRGQNPSLSTERILVFQTG